MIDTNFKILHWNANGFRSRRLELFKYLLDNDIQVTLLNGTKLNPGIRISILIFTSSDWIVTTV